MKVKFLSPVEVEKMMNARPLRLATHSAVSRHTVSGNALDWLNLSPTERAQADRELERGVRVVAHQQNGDLDLSEYRDAIDEMLANLSRVSRAFEADGVTIEDLRGAFTDMVEQGDKWLDQLQAKVRTGLQNGYVKRRK